MRGIYTPNSCGLSWFIIISHQICQNWLPITIIRSNSPDRIKNHPWESDDTCLQYHGVCRQWTAIMSFLGPRFTEQNISKSSKNIANLYFTFYFHLCSPNKMPKIIIPTLLLARYVPPAGAPKSSRGFRRSCAQAALLGWVWITFTKEKGATNNQTYKTWHWLTLYISYYFILFHVVS